MYRRRDEATIIGDPKGTECVTKNQFNHRALEARAKTMHSALLKPVSDGNYQ